jgi:peptide deformylase
MNLKLVLYPDPRLTQPCLEVPPDYNIEPLVVAMQTLMQRHGGIGLAAPQVGKQLRLLITGLTGVPGLLNPQITWQSTKMATEFEGCLSIPDARVAVPRPKKIKVTGLDLARHKVDLELADYEARVVCHEIDHLNGRLIIDYK